jgi:hypothetical protein
MDEPKTFIEVIFDYLKEILTDLLRITGLSQPVTELVQAQQMDFIKNAGSFDKLYISYYPEGPDNHPRTIRAIRETRAHRTLDRKIEYRTFISAEYRNYQADVCGFFYRHNYHDVRAQISDPKRDNIQCTPVILDAAANEWMHSIFVEEPVFEDIDEDLIGVRMWKGASDTFWNDITAKIRTQDPKELEDIAPEVPTFESVPETPVVGAKMMFNITSETLESDIIARTWEFGDGGIASSAFNVTTLHMYSAAMPYQVRLCVMNSYYRITCSDYVTIDVLAGPEVSIREREQTPAEKLAGTISVEFIVTGGNPPYTISVDWNDTSPAESDIIDVEGGIFSAEHEYGRLGTFAIKAMGQDSTGTGGVSYSDEKPVFVEGP